MTLHMLIDSADPSSWSDLWPLGVFKGITTNPTLLRRAGIPCSLDALENLSVQAFALGCKELHLQAWGGTPQDLLACGQALLALSPERIVVKLPLTEKGLLAAAVLVGQGVRVTLTACYGVTQVLAAAALGCSYVAPYLGRISDSGRDGMKDLLAMQQCLAGSGASTRLLVASVRSPEDLTALVPSGVEAFTLSPSLARQLWTHPASEEAATHFETDATSPLR